MEHDSITEVVPVDQMAHTAYLLALMNDLMFKPHEALHYFKKAVVLDPTNQQYLTALAEYEQNVSSVSVSDQRVGMGSTFQIQSVS